ncbi:hypothetical protein HAX54_016499 [Datura stramonium]|uniref:NAC domain-containing protein n=1 Tax=Datura stramonium TaxID=4076 RepID=A0ABS8UK93_DATST|nr:hypothetical protein [Datura stramonium]
MMMELYEFRPTDLELLTFLLRFIAKEPLCDDGFITQHDLYKQEPWETYRYGRHYRGVQDHNEDDTSSYRYFITPIRKKKSRFRRTVGEKIGIWKQMDDVIISCCENSGRKKSLCYETTKSYPDDGKWVMKEYTLSDTLLRKFNKSEFRDYVICAIKNKTKKDSSNLTKIHFVKEPMVGTGVDEPLMDQEYEMLTCIINFVEEPILVESDVQIQEVADEEKGVLGLTTSSQFKNL